MLSSCESLMELTIKTNAASHKIDKILANHLTGFKALVHKRMYLSEIARHLAPDFTAVSLPLRMDSVKYLKNYPKAKPFIVSETVQLATDPAQNLISYTLQEKSDVRVTVEKDEV